jgi:hypothetical protein
VPTRAASLKEADVKYVAKPPELLPLDGPKNAGSSKNLSKLLREEALPKDQPTNLVKTAPFTSTRHPTPTSNPKQQQSAEGQEIP